MSLLEEYRRLNLDTACSALHFAPVDTVEWQITFRHKFLDDITVALLP